MTQSYIDKLRGILECANDCNFRGANVDKKEVITNVCKILTENKWLPDKNGVFYKPSEILLSDLPDDFEKESVKARILAEKLGMKEDIEQEYWPKRPEEEKKRFELAKRIPLEKLEMIAEELDKGKFPEQPAPDKERRKLKAIDNYKESPKKKSEERKRLVRISQDQIDKKTSLRIWYQNNDEKVICQICKRYSSFKNQQGKYYFEAVEMVKDEKEYDANVLALCPLCDAKYLYGERTDDEKIKQELSELYDDFKNNSIGQKDIKITISLCGETADIQFVEKHLIDLSPILRDIKE